MMGVRRWGIARPSILAMVSSIFTASCHTKKCHNLAGIRKLPGIVSRVMLLNSAARKYLQTYRVDKTMYCPFVFS